MKNLNRSKVKYRSKKDLIFRKKGFLEIADFLKKKKIFFFFASGVLLGFKREKNFIPWDWDVEFDFYEPTFLKNLEIIKKYLKDNKFKLVYENIDNRKIEYVKYRPASVTKFTFRAWKYDFISRNYIRKNLNIPKKYFQNMTKIKFANRFFNCPGPLAEYLEYFYGDWRTPVRTADKSIYLTNKLFRQNLGKFYFFINKFKSMIIKFFKK